VAVKGGLSVDEPVGERWDLALELIERGERFVVLGDRVQLVRHVGWPGPMASSTSPSWLVRVALLRMRSPKVRSTLPEGSSRRLLPRIGAFNYCWTSSELHGSTSETTARPLGLSPRSPVTARSYGPMYNNSFGRLGFGLAQLGSAP